MKKIIKPVFALVLITMGVIVLMKMNKIWALNHEQNPNEASELKSEQNLNEALEMKSEQNPNETSALNLKKNLNVEYFISGIDSDTTYKDLEREIGPVTGSRGSGVIRKYYETEGLIFLDYWSHALSEEGTVIKFMVQDTSRNYKGLIMYIEENFKSTEYIKKLFAEGKIISDVDKIEIKPRQFFDLNYEYTYEDIVNLYGKPHGITDNNRIYYHINSYYVFFPADFSSNQESKLNYIDLYSEDGKFKCRIQYAPEVINDSLNIFYD